MKIANIVLSGAALALVMSLTSSRSGRLSTG